MNEVKSIIIDDNYFSATILSDMLEEHHPSIKVVSIAKNGQEGIIAVNHIQPELIFLDIEMPDMNGFEMLKQLNEIHFQTIFTTAHSNYAIKAFRFNALDYLVKPIDEKELAEAIHRFKSNENMSTKPSTVQQALTNFSTKVIEEQKLILQTQKGIIRFTLKDILKIEGERNYSFIYLSNGNKELSSKTLGYFENILSDKGFFRCHRSFLVNRFHVQKIVKDQFVLKNSSSIPISRRKKVEAQNWFLD